MYCGIKIPLAAQKGKNKGPRGRQKKSWTWIDRVYLDTRLAFSYSWVQPVYMVDPWPLVWEMEQHNRWGLWDAEMGLTDLEDEVTLLSICLLVPLA